MRPPFELRALAPVLGACAYAAGPLLVAVELSARMARPALICRALLLACALRLCLCLPTAVLLPLWGVKPADPLSDALGAANINRGYAPFVANGALLLGAPRRSQPATPRRCLTLPYL